MRATLDDLGDELSGRAVRPARPNGSAATASTRHARGGRSACARDGWTAVRRSAAGATSLVAKSHAGSEQAPGFDPPGPSPRGLINQTWRAVFPCSRVVASTSIGRPLGGPAPAEWRHVMQGGGRGAAESGRGHVDVGACTDPGPVQPCSRRSFARHRRDRRGAGRQVHLVAAGERAALTPSASSAAGRLARSSRSGGVLTGPMERRAKVWPAVVRRLPVSCTRWGDECVSATRQRRARRPTRSALELPLPAAEPATGPHRRPVAAVRRSTAGRRPPWRAEGPRHRARSLGGRLLRREVPGLARRSIR